MMIKDPLPGRSSGTCGIIGLEVVGSCSSTALVGTSCSGITGSMSIKVDGTDSSTPLV